jgi:Zn-dependent metalloprotease
MLSIRNPLHCITPPHILKALMEQKDKRLPDTAIRTLAMTVRARERRTILGRLRVTTAVGQKHRTIYDVKHHADPSPTGQMARDEGDPATADQVVNEAYDGFGITYDFYKAVFNRNSVDDHGMARTGFVHYGDKYDNAFWDGQEMVFGDGDGILFTGFTGRT